MDLVIVTGMSGAGKSRAVQALEDIGFYCVDNMPPKLIPTFVQLCMESNDEKEGLRLLRILDWAKNSQVCSTY